MFLKNRIALPYGPQIGPKEMDKALNTIASNSDFGYGPGDNCVCIIFL